MFYSRAYVDRESSDDGLLRFIAATEGVKGDGIDIRMSGAKLERYRANPIFGYGHRYWSREDLPIGRAKEVELVGQKLRIGVEFDDSDDFAQKVEQKYRGGFLNAVSIGFEVTKWENDEGSYWRGGVAEEWELLEVSAVPVPVDANAVVESGRALRDIFGVPLDPGVHIERDSVTLTRTVRVSEDLIRQADPLQLGVNIARHLVEAPLVQNPPVPQPQPEPAPAPQPEPQPEPVPARSGLDAVDQAWLRDAVAGFGLDRVADALGVAVPDPDEARLETVRQYGISRGWWRAADEPTDDPAGEPDPEPEPTPGPDPEPAPEPDPAPESTPEPPAPGEGVDDEAARGLLAAFDREKEIAQ